MTKRKAGLKFLTNTDVCPYCEVDLNGDQIPDEYNSPYRFEGEIRYPYGSPDACWRREIGVEVRGKYDGVWEWECPDCRKRWDSTVKLLRKR